MQGFDEDDDWAPETEEEKLSSGVGKLVISADLDKPIEQRLDMLHNYFQDKKEKNDIGDGKVRKFFCLAIKIFHFRLYAMKQNDLSSSRRPHFSSPWSCLILRLLPRSKSKNTRNAFISSRPMTIRLEFQLICQDFCFDRLSAICSAELNS